MKRIRLASLLLAALMLFSLAAGCRRTPQEDPNGTSPVVDGKGNGSGTAGGGDAAPAGPIGVANPYQELSSAESFGLELTLPQGAEDVHYFDINTGGGAHMLQMQFRSLSVQYVLRARTATRLTNISPLYVTWKTEEAITVAGHEGKVCMTGQGSGAVLWYDAVRSMAFSLSTDSAAEEDAMKALAETLYAKHAISAQEGSGTLPPPPALEETTVIVYTPAADGVSFMPNEFTVKEVDGDWVIGKLKELGVLTGNVALLSMEEITADESGNAEIALDLSFGFGTQMRSQNARGEYMLVGSVVNSFLSVFGGIRLWLFVDGETPQTANYDYNHVLTFYGTYQEPKKEEPKKEEEKKEEPKKEDQTSAEDPNKSVAEKICALAQTKIGAEFESGGTGPNTFDNSGFVYWCFKENGISIPRRTTEMYKGGTEISSQSDLKPGDLVFFTYEEDRSASYVGIYLGGGKFIAESKPGNPVKIMDLNSSYWSSIYIGARRYT